MAKKQRPKLDEFIGFQQLAKLTEPGPVHWMTCYRWATRGIKSGRQTIRLRTLRTGNRRLTKLRWYNEFCAALQDDASVRDEILAPNRATLEKQLERELASHAATGSTSRTDQRCC